MIGRDLIVTRNGARFLGRRIPCAIGRGGMTANKREGDGATPVGIYPFAGFRAFFRPDRLDIRGAARTRRNDIWSDGVDDPHYNQPGKLGRSGGYPFSHERMWRADHLYDVVIDIGYNVHSPIPGRGSAIFIHHWRKPRHPTEGCIAFDPADLRWILSHALPWDRLVIRG